MNVETAATVGLDEAIVSDGSEQRVYTRSPIASTTVQQDRSPNFDRP